MDQLITNVDSIILGFLQGSFGNLSGTVHTLWQLMFIVFIAFYGYKVIVSGQFSAPDLVAQCLKIILLLVLATSWDVFFQFIYRTVTDLPSDIAGQMLIAAADSLGAKSQVSSTVTANVALSEYYTRAMKVSDGLLEGAGMNNLWLYLYAFTVWIGAIGFTGYATMLILLSKIAVAILLAIGPLFILLFIFTNTKYLFEGWLRNLLSYALIPVFVYALLALLLAIGEAPLQYMEKNSGTYDNLVTVVGHFFLTMFISILLLAQIMGIASSITSGMSLSTMGIGSMSLRKAGSFARAGTGMAATWGWQKTAPARERASNYASKNIEAGRKKLGETLKSNREKAI